MAASGMLLVPGPGPSEPGASCTHPVCIPASPCAGGQQTWGAPQHAWKPPRPHPAFIPWGDSLRAWKLLWRRWGQQPPGSTRAVTVSLGPVCNWERDSQVCPTPKFCRLRCRHGDRCHRCHPPPLLMSSLFLPRDSEISAGLGRGEGQKPLPCQKKEAAAALSASVKQGWIINPSAMLSLCPAVPLPVLAYPMTQGCDTFPVT